MTMPISIADLPFSGSSYAFEGMHFGDVNLSFFLVEAPPKSGPGLHRHPYAEVFIVQEGEARFTLGEDTIIAGSGQIVVVQPGQAHAFVNAGEGSLRMVAMHANDQFVTEWLDHESG